MSCRSNSFHAGTQGDKFPARLHVHLARDSRRGLIIRHGSSKSVCTVLWNRDKDTFELGQWMRGRIYEKRCDLSPSGNHFIYFAVNGRLGSDTKGSWTAVSRVPYLKSISLFGKGDCWHGGGLFLSDKEFWLNDGYGHTELQVSGEVIRNTSCQPPTFYNNECLTVYYNRLQRDGWILKGKEGEGFDLFEKELPNAWVLRKFAHSGVPPGPGLRCYWDTHELWNESSGVVLTFPNWCWADWDLDRVVWATEGQLWGASLRNEGLVDGRMLYDFNDMEFQAIEAPY